MEQKDLQHKYAELVVERATLTGYSKVEQLKAVEKQIVEVRLKLVSQCGV